MHFYPSLDLEALEAMPEYLQDQLYEEIAVIRSREILNLFDVAAYAMTNEEGRIALSKNYLKNIEGIEQDKIVTDPRELASILGRTQ